MKNHNLLYVKYGRQNTSRYELYFPSYLLCYYDIKIPTQLLLSSKRLERDVLEYLYRKTIFMDLLYALFFCFIVVWSRKQSVIPVSDWTNAFQSSLTIIKYIVLKKREETLLMILVLTKTNENMNSLTIHIKRWDIINSNSWPKHKYDYPFFIS